MGLFDKLFRKKEGEKISTKATEVTREERDFVGKASLESAREKSRAGMNLIRSGEFSKGWAFVEQAQREAPNDQGIKDTYESMAFYILKKIIEKEARPANLDIDRLIEVLKRYTSKGLITDPFLGLLEREGPTTVVSGQVATSITLEDAKRAKNFSIE